MYFHPKGLPCDTRPWEEMIALSLWEQEANSGSCPFLSLSFLLFKKDMITCTSPEEVGEGLSWEGPVQSSVTLGGHPFGLDLSLHSVPASHFCINQNKPEVSFVTFFHEKLKLKEEPKHKHKSLLCPCYCSRRMP